MRAIPQLVSAPSNPMSLIFLFIFTLSRPSFDRNILLPSYPFSCTSDHRSEMPIKRKEQRFVRVCVVISHEGIVNWAVTLLSMCTEK